MNGMEKVLILAADDVEDVELLSPYYRLMEEGYLPVVASSKKGEITGKHGYKVRVDLSYNEVEADEYFALLLPGGRSPERVRVDMQAIRIVKSFVERRKPIAAICHGPQILISAGADYEDKEVVEDGELITSRQPSDLPSFMSSFLKLLQRTKKRLQMQLSNA